MSFGSWLLNMITDADLNQSTFAARVGVSPQTVSRWVNDDDLPRGRHIVPIARALGVSEALVTSHLPGATPLDEQETFYANMPGNLTEEEKRGILAYIRGMRGNR